MNSLNLLADEEILSSASISKAVFITPAALLAIFIFSLYLGESFIFLTILSLFFFVAFAIRALIIKLTSKFVLTNSRLILQTGLITRAVTEINLLKYEGVQLRQGLLGRLLNYGTIEATTGGVTSSYPFVSDPRMFINSVHEAAKDAALSS